MHSLALDRVRSMNLLARRPRFWGALASVAIAATWLCGTLFGVVVVAAVFAATIAVARTRRGRAWLEHSAQLAAWQSRCDARELQLVRANVSPHGLDEATRLVRLVHSCDPTLTGQLELEGLLDHYVEVSIRTRCCERVLSATQRFSTAGSALRQDLEARQADARRALQERIRAYRDELDAVPELLCLLAQRSVLDVTAPSADPVGERLAHYADLTDGMSAIAA